MRFNLFALLPLAAATVATAPAAQATCNTAYNGPGQTFSCSKVSWVQTSYVCYVGSGATYCCSGTAVSTSAGLMVGGCL
ncbi:hypothetical protein BDZ89DRAFT_1059640 [Hymenopellis radicata]|nr:hypothetical protein BDZ89DRAFT_1059640 [Hymenopellis radicata]